MTPLTIFHATASGHRAVSKAVSLSRAAVPRCRLLLVLCAKLGASLCVAPSALADAALPQGHLMDALRAVAANHPSVSAARGQEQAARLDLSGVETRRLPRPSIALTSRAGVTSAEARLTQTLHDWGATSARIDAARSQVGAAAARTDDTGRAVVLELLEQWRQWAVARARIASQDAALQRLARYEQSARARGRAGFGSDADVALVLGRVAQAGAEMASYRAAAAAAHAQLRALGFHSMLDPPMLPGTDSWPFASPLLPGRWLVRAEQDSPVLARLRSEAQAADATARALQADRWPVINAVASHQQVDGGASSRLYLSVEYAPGSWGGDAQATRAALARADAARAALESARIDLARGLQSEWTALSGLQQRLGGETAGVEANRAVLQSFERQFEAGRKSWLDVLNAARELTAAEAAAAAVALELAVGQVRLAVMIGLPSATELQP